MSKNRHTPAKAVIDKMGGVVRVSEITGRHISRVYRWMAGKEQGGTGGVIPQGEASKLLAQAKLEGIDLQASEFFAAVQDAEAA